MPDEPNPASSAALAEPEAPKDLKQYSGPEYDHWRKTGETYEQQKATKPEAAPPSSESEPQGESASPSEGDTKAPKRKTAEDRKNDLKAEIQELLRQRAELKTPPKPADASKPAESSPAEAKPAATGKPERPKLDAFETYAMYEMALDKYFEDLTDWKADQKFSARDQKAEEQQRTKNMQERWEPRLREGRETWPDYDLVALNEELRPHLPRSVGDFLNESEFGSQILYVLGTDLANAERIAKLSGPAQFRELHAIEQEFSKEKASQGAKTEPRVSRTPPPARVLRGGSQAPDPEAAAIESGNFTAYKQAADARERASRRR